MDKLIVKVLTSQMSVMWQRDINYLYLCSDDRAGISKIGPNNMLKQRQASGNMIGNGVVPGTSVGTSSPKVEEHNFAPFTNIRIV